MNLAVESRRDNELATIRKASKELQEALIALGAGSRNVQGEFCMEAYYEDMDKREYNAVTAIVRAINHLGQADMSLNLNRNEPL